MTDILRQIIDQNRAGTVKALPSVCSAHPDVLLASLLLAQELGQPIIIEATSNQVNQDGGYTGMRPADFVAFVTEIADRIGFDTARIIFGGDHLGPQVWRGQSADAAMTKAEILVAEYVRAGFTKIHLDCSEGCAGEPAQVDDDLSASRAARLAAICERATDAPETLSYIVGTEVPPPGGAREAEVAALQPTDPQAAKITLQKHFEAFDTLGLSDAKSRIVALVVQPGVEFSADHIDHLPAGGNPDLRAAINQFDGVCFEAHSTDYQHPQAYIDLAKMGFAIHKVGPALTFAYRKAVYALDMAVAMLPQTPSRLSEVMETLMQENPVHWRSHYHGTDSNQKWLRHYSYADRIRYYWTQPAAQQAVKDLMERVETAEISEPVWDQFFCFRNRERTEALIARGYSATQSRILAEIQLALAPYFFNVEKG
ncbi:MAG: class II D-tagatose-bisphosphate aldolase, non-catalytic subunit [Rhodobacteraceae bacterium]|nr:class II D-tagatose-bisphosphate aldolase, non-catalytic subunit [Paracoccaceae bacterium]